MTDMESASKTDSGNVLPRVTSLETSVKLLHGEIGDVRASVQQVQQSVNAGFGEIRRDLLAKSQTNWGWVIAAVSVAVAMVGAVGTAWVRPLQAYDEQVEKRIDRIQLKVETDHDMMIQLGERIKHVP